MFEKEVPSVNPKLDAMCEMLKTIHDLQERNKMLEAQIERMKNCKNCKKLKKEKDGLLFCTVGSIYTNIFGKNCDKWEIKEND